MKKNTFLLLLICLFFTQVCTAQDNNCEYQNQIDKLSTIIPTIILKTNKDIPKIDDEISGIAVDLKGKKPNFKKAWEDIVNKRRGRTVGTDGKERNESNFECLNGIARSVVKKIQKHDKLFLELDTQLKNISSYDSNPFPNDNSFLLQKELIAYAYLTYLLKVECTDGIVVPNPEPVDETFTKEQQKVIDQMNKRFDALDENSFTKNELWLGMGILSLLSLAGLILGGLSFMKRKKKSAIGALSKESLSNKGIDEKMQTFFQNQDLIRESKTEKAISNKFNLLMDRIQKLETNHHSFAGSTSNQETVNSKTNAFSSNNDLVEEFYSNAPNKMSGLFFGSKLRKEFRSKETIYVITMKNSNSATFTLVNDMETKKYAFNMMDANVLPAMDIEGERKGAEYIRSIVPGELTKDGSNWKIKRKGKIQF